MKGQIYLKLLFVVILISVLLVTDIVAVPAKANFSLIPKSQEIYCDHEAGGFYIVIPQDWTITSNKDGAIDTYYIDTTTQIALKVGRVEDSFFNDIPLQLKRAEDITLKRNPSAVVEKKELLTNNGYDAGSLEIYSPNDPDMSGKNLEIFWFMISHPNEGVVVLVATMEPASSWGDFAEAIKAIALSISFEPTEIPTDTPVPPTETPTPTATPTSTPIFQEGETFYDHPEGGFYITFPQEFCMDMGEEKLDFSEGSIAAISSGCLRGDAILGFAFARIPFSATPNLVDISDWAAAIKSYSTETGKAEGNTDFFLSNGYNAVSLEFFYPQDSGDLEVYWFVIEHPNNGVVLLLAAIDPATSWNNPDVAEIVKNIARSIRPVSEIRTQVFLLLLQNEAYSLQAQENIKIF